MLDTSDTDSYNDSVLFHLLDSDRLIMTITVILSCSIFSTVIGSVSALVHTNVWHDGSTFVQGGRFV